MEVCRNVVKVGNSFRRNRLFINYVDRRCVVKNKEKKFSLFEMVYMKDIKVNIRKFC